MTDKPQQEKTHNADDTPMHSDVNADRSVWLIWAGIMLVTIAILPFAVRNQDMVWAIARMCGFDIG